MAHIISIDAGSSSLRSVVYDECGRRLFMAQQQYQPFSTGEGRVEQQPAVWQRALFETLRATGEFACEKQIAIDAISLTSQRSSVFAVDGEGAALCNAMTWHDKRSVPLCEDMRGEEAGVYQKTGLRLDPMFSAPKMAWLTRNDPQTCGRAHKLLGVHEYLLHCLCGRFVTDHSIASRTMLQNLFTLDWDDDLLQLFGIRREQLCEIVGQGTVCGSLWKKAAQASGLQVGIPVVSAGGDQQCGALGLGIARPGQLEATTGTGAYVVGLTDRPVLDKKMRFLCNVAAVPGLYVVEAPVLTAGNVYRWFADFCLSGHGAEGMIEEANRLALEAPPGAHDLMVFPYFKGRGAPEWNATMKGAVLNLTLDTKKSDLSRAILEGLAFEIAENVAVIEKNDNTIRDRMLVSGGLTRNPLYNQILANISGKRIDVGDDAEATALGAWMSAAAAIGLYEEITAAAAIGLDGKRRTTYAPEEEAARTYQEIKEKRQKAFLNIYQ